MKICQVCKQTYSDDTQNYCLNDGNILEKVGDDAPPTVFMNQARTTNQNWSDYETKNQWQNQPLANNQPYGMVGQNAPLKAEGQNQTLAIVSLILGILGILLTFCCYAGIPLGIGALITGYLATNNIKNEPMVYSGRGMALGGMITGALGLVFTIFWIIFVILLN